MIQGRTGKGFCDIFGLMQKEILRFRKGKILKIERDIRMLR